MIENKVKALALISGGLDSILAALIIKKQGIKVQGLAFKSLFFDAPIRQPRGCRIPLKIIDISENHFKIVKNPKHGYGKNANPCLDCHLLMLKEAKKLMVKSSRGRPTSGWGFDFIITGEVLGQRPFSQNKNSLTLIEKEAGLKGLILRPLSAKLLALTIPEQKGWVKREKLLNISGRSRKTQLELAKKFKLSGFSAPGTSCILTDPEFSKRLFKLLKTNPQCSINDIRLLKLGRHFWQNKNLIIVGRNHEENLHLKKLTQKGDIILEPQSFPGPTILIRSYSAVITNFNLRSPIITRAKKLLLKYSPRSPKNLLKKDFSICPTAPRTQRGSGV